MKKFLLGALLLSLLGCNDRVLYVKDLKAPTHPKERPINIETYCRKIIEFATPENDTLSPEDIEWGVASINDKYEATVFASYKNTYKIFINMNSGYIVNMEMFRGNTITSIKDIINSERIKNIKKLPLPYSKSLFELSKSMYLPMKSIEDACYLLLSMCDNSNKTIEKNMVAYRVVAETNDGIIMRVAYGYNYVDVHVHYNGELLYFTTDDISLYNYNAGYSQKLSDMDYTISTFLN